MNFNAATAQQASTSAGALGPSTEDTAGKSKEGGDKHH